MSAATNCPDAIGVERRRSQIRVLPLLVGGSTPPPLTHFMEDIVDQEQKVEDKKVEDSKGVQIKKSGPITIKLKSPIKANGEEVSELTFREPTAADIELNGNPVNLDWTGGTPKPYFDARVMSQMMSVLAAVPPSSVRMMNTKDWNTVAWSLANFFMPDW